MFLTMGKEKKLTSGDRKFRALRVSPSVHDLFPCLCFLEMDLKGDHIAVFGAGDGVSGLEE